MSARVIVCGSRSWGDRQKIQDALADITDDLGTCDITIVHGGARGADLIAADEAGKHGFRIEKFLANWERYGKRAGLIRNHQMAVSGADLCLAFWDQRSSGTAHMIEEARKAGIPVKIIEK